MGGKDEVVETDETFIGKRKYNRGRSHSQKIIFGGISRIIKKIFMKVIPKRNKLTLKHAIESFIVPNSTDIWSSYMSFFNDNAEFGHGTVNHSINFVNPENGVHTQNIES